MATHARVFPNSLTAEQALGFLSALLDTSAVTILTPTERHPELLRQTVREIPHPAGNLFHDIHTAVLLREHGIPEIYTSDTDFLQFRFLKVTDPVHRHRGP